MRVRDLRKQKKGLGPCPGQGEDLRRDYSNVCGLLLEFNVLFRNWRAKICGPPATVSASVSFVFTCKRGRQKLALQELLKELKLESEQ